MYDYDDIFRVHKTYEREYKDAVEYLTEETRISDSGTISSYDVGIHDDDKLWRFVQNHEADLMRIVRDSFAEEGLDVETVEFRKGSITIIVIGVTLTATKAQGVVALVLGALITAATLGVKDGVREKIKELTKEALNNAERKIREFIRNFFGRGGIA